MTSVRQSVDYPIFRKPRIKAGVGFQTATIIWGVGGMGAFSLGFPWGLLVIGLTAIVHGVASWFYRFDHKIFEMYAHYAESADEYSAGLHSHGTGSKSRPHGYGKGVPF